MRMIVHLVSEGKDIEEICGILDGWPTDKKLTWEAFLSTIQFRLRKSWSRQALDRHDRISQAFKRKKKFLRNLPPEEKVREVPEYVKQLYQYIERLEAERDRSKQEATDLLEQFARWAYNAAAKGLTLEVLDAALPPVDRRPSTDD